MTRWVYEPPVPHEAVVDRPLEPGPCRYLAHLNGGPRDDQYVICDSPLFGVSKLTRSGIVATTGASKLLPGREGAYSLRFDANGSPVPHDMDGYVEFDWQGWA
jgi:hypothetical protein